MTATRLFSAILIACLSMPGLLAQTATNAGKTFSKSYNISGINQVNLDLPGIVEVRVSDVPSLRIEIAVALPNGSDAMLNELSTVGRYNLTSKTESNLMLLSAPNLQKQVKVKGEVLKENISYIVFAPRNLTVQMTDVAELAQKK